MSNKGINYEEVQRLYELCTQGTDLREFCKDCGVKYESFLAWQRKQLWNEKMGRTEEVKSPRMSSVKITDVPSGQQLCQEQPQGLLEYKLPLVQITLQKGLTISMADMTVESIHTMITKLTSALC